MQLQLNAISYGSRGVKSILKIFKHDLNRILRQKYLTPILQGHLSSKASDLNKPVLISVLFSISYTDFNL